MDDFLPWRSPNDLKNYCNQYISSKGSQVKEGLAGYACEKMDVLGVHLRQKHSRHEHFAVAGALVGAHPAYGCSAPTVLVVCVCACVLSPHPCMQIVSHNKLLLQGMTLQALLASPSPEVQECWKNFKLMQVWCSLGVVVVAVGEQPSQPIGMLLTHVPHMCYAL